MKPTLNSAYICVRDMDRAITFWERFLERKITVRDTLLSRFDVGKFRLLLFDPKAAGETVTYGDNCLLSFKIADMDGLKKKLKALGAKIIYPKTKIGNNWVMEFRDCEGNDVEVYTPCKPRGVK